MGIGGISIWQLVILLVIVILVFGTKRLRNMGGDLGAAIKGFRKGMSDEDADKGEPEKLSEETSQAQADAEFREKEEELETSAKSESS